MLVAVAAPLLALGIRGTRADPVCRHPNFFSPVVASMAELVVVWAWHVPVLHRAARHGIAAACLEQGSFLFTGLWLWLAAMGGVASRRRGRAAAGIAGLLLTSMHMTLLGALLALSPRVLYGHAMASAWLTPLQDQQLGGAVMIVIGGLAYLGGAVWATGVLLRDPATIREDG